MMRLISFLLVWVAIFGHTTASADPIISSIDAGNIINKKLTINGKNFGSGPNIKIFDDFEGGTADQSIPYTNAKVGTWKQYKTTVPPPTFYNNFAHSGKSSAKMSSLRENVTFTIDTTTFTVNGLKENQFLVDMDPGTTEVFISYWVYVPPTSPWPSKHGTTVSDPQPTYLMSFAPTSSWKLAWLFDLSPDGKDTGAESANICMPTWIGSEFNFQGNDLSQQLDPNTNSYKNLVGLDYGTTNLKISSPEWADGRTGWWDWNHFMRLTMWLKADPDQVASLKNKLTDRAYGTLQAQVLTRKSSTQAIYTKLYDPFLVFDSDGTPQFTKLTFPGWVEPASQSTVTLLYDDIYVASGSNAAARVEIGDNEDYNKSTVLAIQTPSSWSTDKIEVDLRQGGLENFNNKYLFVFDSNGLVNTKGYKIAIPPSKPSAVHIK